MIELIVRSRESDAFILVIESVDHLRRYSSILLLLVLTRIDLLGWVLRRDLLLRLDCVEGYLLSLPF